MNIYLFSFYLCMDIKNAHTYTFNEIRNKIQNTKQIKIHIKNQNVEKLNTKTNQINRQ